MSRVFFQELSLPSPDVNLEVGSGSHTAQTAEVMRRLDPVVTENHPDLVLVYGDVNSTLAAALVCAKLGVPVGHVEAGLRSFDRTMPEEINRLLTDRIADFLFTPSDDADENLRREGVATQRIHCVGNVMIDTLVRLLPKALVRWPGLRARFPLPERFGLVTLHRPSNVDKPAVLQALLAALEEIGRFLPLIFPVHPRTRRQMNALASPRTGALVLVDPLGYLEFLALQKHAVLVITDSGGIQEETSFLSIPCLSVRPNTERPVTVTLGTNTLVGNDVVRMKNEAWRIFSGEGKVGRVPPLWDGHAGQRVADIIVGTA
jgi:UDP-N-acetylglucosamine 2-epimerase (non-hydrolysing)